MYDCNVNSFLISNLGNKVNSMLNTIIALDSQGYFVNECKLTKLNNANMFMHVLENDFVLTHCQKHNVNLIINKFLAV